MLFRLFQAGVCCLLSSFFLAGCTNKITAQYLKERNAITSLDQLSEKLQTVDYVILGESHDNPIHHDLQLAVLQKLYKSGWLKQISLEMMIPSQQAGADALISNGVTDPDEIYKQLNWNDGWDWAFYGPIVIWAVSEGIPLKSANLTKDELRVIREQPIRIGEVILGKDGMEAHRAKLRNAHCGHTNRAIEDRMLRVQVARDARMAASLMSIRSGAVLLAGNWHARKDIGVPRYLSSLNPEAGVLTVGFLEQPAMAHLSKPAFYDIAWNTPGIQRQDYGDMCKAKVPN